MSRKKYDKASLVRLTISELESISQKAKKANLSVSRFLVKSGLSDGKVLTTEEKEELNQLRFEVRKVGVNLNQIAYSINLSRRGNGQPPTQAEINEIQDLIKQVLHKLLKKL